MNRFGVVFSALSATLLPILASIPAAAEDSHAGLSPEQLSFFESKIRLVLIEQCYKCHSAEAEKLKGGLTLDTREGTILGGESGHPGVTPGNAGASSVYTAITWQDDDMQMPPKRKLPPEVIADFKKWIEMGAPDPRAGAVAATAKKHEINIDEGRKFWAFQKPVKVNPPETKLENWARTDIDRFLLAGMESAGLQPMADADRHTLIRRIAYDLTGLPPTPDEIDAFVNDRSPDALKRVIDQYLDSPRYGERWGRHWLDVARYAESSGKEVNLLYPHAWRYRDYVIESFNKDKHYDEFIKEQIAGDLLPFDNKRDQAEKIVATGFLAVGSKGHNQRDRRQFALDVADEQIDAVSQSMLGLTIACARCHDHKFDPVTQRDYYALAGIFLSSETLYGTHSQVQNNNPGNLIELEQEAGLPAGLAKISQTEVAELKKRKEDAEKEQQEMTRELIEQRRKGEVTDAALRALFVRDRAGSAKSDYELFDEKGNPRTLVMGVLERNYPINSPILTRGEVSQPGEIVPRGLVEVLLPGKPEPVRNGSGRLDLANFITSKDNPLTARVMVNRIWLHLFGAGLVATPDNFGKMGSQPSNPELLDYLAVRFMENDWSIKSMIREIMMSRAYQMSSGYNKQNYASDPDNKLHWRMSKRRLDAEAIRDGMLAVSGTLDLYPVDGSPVARAGEGRDGLIQLSRELYGKPYNYRSIFLPIIRDQIPEALSLFDFPDASLVSGERDTTNVPSQSLYLMNNSQVMVAADAFAKRVTKVPGTPLDRITYAFRLAYSRPPTPDELTSMRTFWMRFTDEVSKGSRSKQDQEKAQFAALSAFCQGLIESAEFRYLN